MPENRRDSHISENWCFADHCSGDIDCKYDFLRPSSVCRDYILDNCDEVMASDAARMEKEQNSKRMQTFISTYLSFKHPKEDREEEGKRIKENQEEGERTYEDQEEEERKRTKESVDQCMAGWSLLDLGFQ